MGKSVIALVVFAALFVGCGSKNEVTEILSPDRIYEKALVYTRENQLVEELETKAAITATLLNEVFPDRYKDENGIYFFVGIVSELNAKDFNKNYKILLNGMKPAKITKVKTSDDLYRLLPNVNRWGDYYLVEFPPTKAKKLVIDFSVYPYGKVTLSFRRPSIRR